MCVCVKLMSNLRTLTKLTNADAKILASVHLWCVYRLILNIYILFFCCRLLIIYVNSSVDKNEVQKLYTYIHTPV